MGILDFVNNPMIQKMQERKRSGAEIAAALRQLVPDAPLQTTVGTGMVDNSSKRNQFAATLGNSPDAATALKNIALGKQFPQDYTLGYGQERISGDTNQPMAVGRDRLPGGGGNQSAKFNLMHQMPDGTIRMSVNMGGHQIWADDQTPVDFNAAPVLATQQPVTDSAGNTQLVWRQLPRGGGNAPGSAPPAAPAQPASAAPQPNLSAPSNVLSTGPQAAAHAGDVTAAQDTAKMYVDRQNQLPAAKETMRLIQAKNQQLTQRIDDIVNNPNLVNAVGMAPGRLVSSLPGTELANIHQNLQSLQQALSLEGLQEIRNSSKTGGGVGQVTEGEYPILQSLISSVNENMTVGELMKQLQRVKDRVNYTTQAATYKYGDTYGPDFKSRYPTLNTDFEQGVVPQNAAPPPGAVPPPAAAPKAKVVRFEDLP